jgi:O-antigen/teichoic acid export membrane protein
VIERSSASFGEPDGKSVLNVRPSPSNTGSASESQHDQPGEPGESFAHSLSNSDDAGQAIRNAGSLGSSVLITAFLGLLIQFVYQRLLGTSKAGLVGGAESLSILLLGLLTFGVDTYARKEVALAPNKAKTFVSGVVAFRSLCSLGVIIVASLVLVAIGRPTGAVWLFVLFGVSRFLMQTNELLLACLQAIGEVAGISKINIASKLLWALLILGGINLGVGAIAVPIGWVIAEASRAVLLGYRAHRHLGVGQFPTTEVTRMVLRASFPFTASTIISNWSTYFDVTLMSFWFESDEVGLYRLAQQIAGVTFLVGTVLPWVLMPLASRARERSEADFLAVMRRGIQFVFTLAIPGSVLLSLNADTIIGLQGPDWLRAVPALRILAFTLIATYVIMTTMTFLVVDGKAWLTVRLGLFGVVVDVVLNVLFMRLGRERFGFGGAGTTAAMIAVFAEFIVAGLCLRSLGRRAWDRQSEWAIARVVLCGVVVALVDRVLAGKGYSWPRLAADAVLYAGLLFASGAVRIRDLKDLKRS